MTALALSLFIFCGCNSNSEQGLTPVQPPVSELKTDQLGAISDISPARQTGAADSAAPGGVSGGSVVISFNYKRQSGSASNQFALWIEDMSGQLIKTLYATRFTANGGYKNRPDSIPLWVEKSGLASMTGSEVDAVSGATPNAGDLSYTWDLTGADGNTVLPGQYRFFVEDTLR